VNRTIQLSLIFFETKLTDHASSAKCFSHTRARELNVTKQNTR